MSKLEESEIYGAVGTLIFGILVILALFFFSLSFTIIKEEPEALSVNFGNTLESQGLYEPAPASVLEEVKPTPVEPVAKVTPPTPTPPSNPVQEVKTQDFEESLAIAEARKKEQERQKVEQEQRRIEQEKIRIEQQKIAEQRRIEAEKAKRAAEIKARAQGAFSGAGGVGTSTTSTGDGTGKGTGNQGNPFGDNSTNRVGTTTGSGSSFKLGNRRTVGALSEPEDNTQVAGKIVVDITVNANGDVIEANIGQGTNITEISARNAALSAARKTKFSKGEKTEIGIITYNYKLN